MSFASEFDSLAKLLLDAAAQIANGVEGSYADEEAQHPQATVMRRVERQCRRKATELRTMAAALKTIRGTKRRRRAKSTGSAS
jgi:hypothetical protein